MIGLLLLCTSAHADDTARLLGPEPIVHATAPSSSSSVDLLGFWPLLVAGGLAAGLWAWQRRPKAEGGQEVATVENIGRHSLGGAHVLHLVDVEDRAGRVRRLIVATGASGSAQLIADLGPDEPELRRAEAPRRAEAEERRVPVARAAVDNWLGRGYGEARPEDDRVDAWAREERAPTREDRAPIREDRAPSREDRAPIREDRREVRAPERREARADRRDPAEMDAPRRPSAQDRRAQALSLIDEVVGNHQQASAGRRGLRA